MLIVQPALHLAGALWEMHLSISLDHKLTISVFAWTAKQHICGHEASVQLIWSRKYWVKIWCDIVNKTLQNKNHMSKCQYCFQTQAVLMPLLLLLIGNVLWAHLCLLFYLVLRDFFGAAQSCGRRKWVHQWPKPGLSSVVLYSPYCCKVKLNR